TQASDRTQAEFERRTHHLSIVINLSQEVQNSRGPGTVSTTDVPILRDGKAPVNRLTGPLYGQPYVLQETNTTHHHQQALPENDRALESSAKTRKSVVRDRNNQYVMGEDRATW